MKSKILLFSLLLAVCSIAWGQTSYGNLNQGNAGDNGGITNSYFGASAGADNIGNNNTYIGYYSGSVRPGVPGPGAPSVTNVWPNLGDNTSNTFVGSVTGTQSYGDHNIFMGRESGFTNEGSNNAFIGNYSGRNNNGGHNIFIGWRSGQNSNGIYNVFSGSYSGQNNNGDNNTFIGRHSGYRNDANNNTFIGSHSGYDNTTGQQNTFVGRQSGYNNSFGNDNTFVGYRSGVFNTTGDFNTFIGVHSGWNSSTGDGNTLIGYQSGYNNNGQNNNTLIGYQSGQNNNTSNNTFLGAQSGYSNTDGDYNTFLGYQSGYHNIDSSDNTFIGYQSGFNNTNGGSNTFLGRRAGFNNNSGNNNTFLGRSAGANNEGGIGNTFVGSLSGDYNDSGNHNTFLGRSAGRSNTYGSNSTYIGYQSGENNEEGEDNTFIGYQSGGEGVTGSGNVFIGHQAGFTEEGSNRLYIANSDTDTPLIWGNFGEGEGEESNGILQFNGEIRLPMVEEDNEMTANQVLMIYGEDSDATVVWRHVDSLGGGGGYNIDLRVNETEARLEIEDDGGIVFVPLTSLHDNLGNHIATDTIMANNIIPNTDNTYNIGDLTQSFSNIYFDGSLFINDAEFLHTRLNNVAIGNNALGAMMLGGDLNVAIGGNALNNNTTGFSNVAIGFSALQSNESGTGNTAIGRQAMVANIGNNNVAVGTRSLDDNTTGANNIAIGVDALQFNQTGSQNIAIGNGSGPEDAMLSNLQNTIAIGHNATVNVDNAVRIGNYEVTLDAMEASAFWTNVSDSRFKINIQEDVAGLNFINSLRPVSYQLDRRKIREFTASNHATNSDVSKKTIGFIAQEVEQIVEENDYVFTGVKKPRNSNDHYGLRYTEFVVPLTKAVQELSAMVEALQQENATLRERIDTLEGTSFGHTAPSTSTNDNTEAKTIADEFMLYQNIPNPFDKTTTISAIVPQSIKNAKIIIYNLQGLELESYPIINRGSISVEISAGRFPSGMYLYALLTDGQVIDTKKMILTR